MGLVLVTPPALEPLTLDEVVTHLRLDSTNVETNPDAPLVALAGSGGGNVDNGAHRYQVTFVTADGETAGGDLSDAVTVADHTANGKVLVVLPIGSSSVTARKLYRTLAGGETAFLVAGIADNSTTEYTDNVADASLGAQVPSRNTTGDPYLSALIVAAREYAETFTRRALVTQTWRYTLDCFPRSDALDLPRANLLSVTSIQYLDPNGEPQTFGSDNYTVDTAALPGRIVLAYLVVWPFLQIIRNAVTVTFVAGYGPSANDVPSGIKAAMKLLIAFWYENREGADIPGAVNALLWQYRNLDGG